MPSSIRRHAFTLVELLVVISIIGLLSTIAIVSMNASRDKAKQASGQSFDQSVRHGIGDQTIGEWLFNECSGNTASDASGSGNTATFGVASGWSTNTLTKTGCSAAFSGSNYLSTSLNLQSPSVTFTAWIYPTDVSGYNAIIAKDLQYKYMINNGNIYTLTSCNGTSWNGSDLTGTPVPANTWSMSALSVDSTNQTVTLYLNGHVAAKASACTVAAYNSNALAIGSDSASSAYHPFHGNIDDARVYTTAISLAQAHELYAEGLSSHQLANK